MGESEPNSERPIDANISEEDNQIGDTGRKVAEELEQFAKTKGADFELFSRKGAFALSSAYAGEQDAETLDRLSAAQNIYRADERVRSGWENWEKPHSDPKYQPDKNRVIEGTPDWSFDNNLRRYNKDLEERKEKGEKVMQVTLTLEVPVNDFLTDRPMVYAGDILRANKRHLEREMKDQVREQHPEINDAVIVRARNLALLQSMVIGHDAKKERTSLFNPELARQLKGEIDAVFSKVGAEEYLDDDETYQWMKKEFLKYDTDLDKS